METIPDIARHGRGAGSGRSGLLAFAVFSLMLAGPVGARADTAVDTDAALPKTLPGAPIEVPLDRGLRLEYEAYFGGMHIGSARAALERRADRYHLSGEARARGLLDWFSEWRGRAESRGTLARRTAESDGQAAHRPPLIPKPAQHRNRGEWQGDPRWAILEYDADGDFESRRASRPDEDDDFTPIPVGATDGTVDPMSAIVALSEMLASGGTCEATLRLFDGRRRYDVRVSDGGTTQFARNDYTIYAGEARACRLEIERIGGFRAEQSKYSETARDRTVWVGRPIADAPPVPVRAEVETAFGRLVIHLVGAYAGAERIALDPGRDIMAEE
ncbi:DUF3108 domain-containing protein [Marivibrio halodurans]|uniref:DUF3108 domain-containing protein n=1 Tax=Marivibrio halodurans TaxID=2039722 RepID=A0A8J7S6G1_9PROT|nr:DUF3108 domain-containing protein [Marivibrio halodurans]MBP5857634.1 DUF3108 domain-containing protein [Marivibrio halodurans]